MGKDIPRNSGQQPKCSEGVLCSVQYACWGNGHGGRHDAKRHIERAAHIAKAQPRLGSINRVVAGCEIDKATSAEIAFAIFIAMHNLPMAVGDEFWLLRPLVVEQKYQLPLFHAFSSGLSRFFVR